MVKTGLLLVALLLQVCVAYSLSSYGTSSKYSGPERGYSNYMGRRYDNCAYSPKCDPYDWWRLTDGSCNNLQITNWGASMQNFKRLLPPAYNNGKNSPRSHSTVDYSPLNSPRDIANKVHYPYDYRNQLTNLFVVFGQFVLHDVTEIYIQKGPDGQIVQCTCESKNPDCLKIAIPKDDYYFKDSYCHVQIRAREARNCDGYGGYAPAREILNKVNSWLDQSNTYGNTLEEENNLRSFYNGRLRVSYYKNSAGPLMPSSCPASTFHLVGKTNVCFQGGDDRANQYPPLTAIHTMLVREHNRIADELYKINPHWPEEKLYQETKRINNAVYQNIVYWEWLPLLIGKEVHNIFDLDIRPYGNYFEGYDQYVNPNTAIEFGAAAGRYGHALTRPYISRVNADYVTTYNYTLKETMFHPDHCVPDYNVDQYVLGMIKDSAYDNSPHLNNEISNWLIVDHGNYNRHSFYSLPAMNINRGREVGVAPYIYYRKLAGLNVPYSWEELTGIKPEIIGRLKQVYKHVEDIDLYTGGASEIPVNGGIMGPTFSYIIASGFRDWKYGDRWFYENSPRTSPYAFNLQQLDAIKNVRMNSIVCNTIYAKHVPYNVFMKADPSYNEFIPCSKVYQLNLNLFREQPVSYAKQTYNPY